MTIKNQVQLITYPDSFGKNLMELHYVLRKYLIDAIGGVHILPFYPSSSDRGFAPLTYDDVDPNFGTWDDVNKIGEDFDLMIDFMVNHISRQSLFFQDYLENGEASKYADMFLSFNKLMPGGEISDEDLAKVYTTATPTYVSPWLPWMGMGDTAGHALWVGPALKLDRVEQYPRELLDFMERYFPQKLTAKPA